MIWLGGPWQAQDNRGGQELPEVEPHATPLIGYRSWLVTPSYTLRSLHVDYDWVVGENRALCLARASEHDDPAPSLDCACGLYAQNGDEPITEWQSMTRARASASGTIRMWGRVVQCQRGYKAQYADLESPIVLDATCHYNCDATPVRVEVGQDVVWAYCEQHANDREGTTVLPIDVWLRLATQRLSETYDLEVFSWAI